MHQNNNFFLQQPARYLHQPSYPKKSPYIQQNFMNFGKGAFVSIMPIRNQLEISQQKSFYSKDNNKSRNYHGQNHETNRGIYQLQNQQYVQTQVSQNHVTEGSDQCFCCLGSIKINEQMKPQEEQIFSYAQLQISKGQRLLTSHQKFIQNLEKERERQYKCQNSIEQSNKNKQHQSSLFKYFKNMPQQTHNTDNSIQEQPLQEYGNKCSECYRRICSQCSRTCEECRQIFCKFDYSDENLDSKHRCNY